MPSCLWPKVEVVVLTSPGALQIILNLRVRYTEKCRVPFWETLVFSKWTEGQEVSRDWGLLRIVKKKKNEGKVSILWTRPSMGLDAPVQSSGSSMELFVHLFTHSFIRLSTQCLFTECKAL